MLAPLHPIRPIPALCSSSHCTTRLPTPFTPLPSHPPCVPLAGPTGLTPASAPFPPPPLQTSAPSTLQPSCTRRRHRRCHRQRRRRRRHRSNPHTSSHFPFATCPQGVNHLELCKDLRETLWKKLNTPNYGAPGPVRSVRPAPQPPAHCVRRIHTPSPHLLLPDRKSGRCTVAKMRQLFGRVVDTVLGWDPNGQFGLLRVQTCASGCERSAAARGRRGKVRAVL